jgi:hypothetical protein
VSREDRNKLALIGGSACLGIGFSTLLLWRIGFPAHLLWIVGISTVLIASAVLTVGIKSARKKAPMDDRLPAKDDDSHGRITAQGMIVLIIGGLFNIFGRQLIGLVWVLAGFGLIKKKEWGRRVFVALACFHIGAVGIAAVSGLISKAIAALHLEKYELIVCAIGVSFLSYLSWALYFFTRPKIRHAFELSSKRASVEGSA